MTREGCCFALQQERRAVDASRGVPRHRCADEPSSDRKRPSHLTLRATISSSIAAAGERRLTLERVRCVMAHASCLPWMPVHDVALVIVSYNTRDYLDRCLHEVVGTGHFVVVV